MPSRYSGPRKKSADPARPRNIRSRRSSVLEILEAREMMTGAPAHILSLTSGPNTIYGGDSLALTASIDPNTPVSQVKFYLDSNHNGAFDGADALIGTAQSGSNNDWTVSSIPTGGTHPVGVGRQLFFAQATDSANTLSNVISMPGEILASGPVVEPIDNDQIIAGRRFVLAAKADLPPTAPHDGTMSYELDFVTDSNYSTAPTGYTFNTATGTMIWDTTAASAAPYHFKVIAKYDNGTSQVYSQPRPFFLTVVSGPQYLTSATDPNAPAIGPLNSTQPVFYKYSDPAAGAGTIIQASIDPSQGPGAAAAGANQVSTLIYNANTDPHPIIEADIPVAWLSNTSAAYMTAQVTILDHTGSSTAAQGDTVYYTMAGVSAGQLFHLALPVDASSLDTGQYNVTVHLAFLDGSGTQLATQDFGSGQGLQHAAVSIVNRNASSVGSRWGIAGLDQVVPYTDGILLVHGNGSTEWLLKNATTGAYAGGMALVGGRFRWTAPGGAYEEFDTTSGNLLLRADAQNNQIEYAYYTSPDSGTGVKIGSLKSIEDPSQRKETFAYDANGMLSVVADFAGRTTTLAYSNGLLTQVTKADGSHQVFGYDASDRLYSQANELGETTYYEYDSLDRLTRMVYPDGSFSILQSSDTTSAAQRVIADYSGTTPIYLGSSRTLAAPLLAWGIDDFGPGIANHTFMGAMGRFVDPSGNTTHYTTDANGGQSSSTQPILGSASAPWEQGPSTFALSDVTTGLLAVKIGPSPTGTGIVDTAYTYDSRFNRTAVYENDATIPAESWSYTAPNSGTNPLNHQFSTTLNDVTGQYAARTTNYAYFSNGLLETITDPLQGTTGYTYTTASSGIAAGLVQTVTDPNGNVTRYDYYSAADSQADANLPSGSLAESGRLKQVTLAYNSTTDAATTTFRYDQYGNLAQITAPGNRVTTYSYDLLGRVTQVQLRGFASAQLAGPTWTYFYNSLGERIQSRDADDNRTEYLYNLRDQLAAIVAPDPTGGGQLPGPETVSYYRPNLQIDTVIDPLGHWTSYSYNARNQLIALAGPSPTTGLIDSNSPVTKYSYNDAGSLTTETDPLSTGVTHYDFDALGRLLSVRNLNGTGSSNNHQSNGLVAAYTYDGFGEVTSTTVPLGSGVMSTTDYRYDSMGRQIYVFPADPTTGTASDQVNAQTTDFYHNVYDAGGRLTDTTTPAPDSTHPAQTTSYVYDHQGRMTQSIQPAPSSGASRPTTQYGYDPNYLYAKMTDPVGNITTRNYDQYGRLVNEVSQGWNFTTSSLTPFGTRYYQYDPDGNLTQYTDRDGRIDKYVFDALGRMTTEKWFDNVNGTSTLMRTLAYQYDLDNHLTSASDPSATYGYVYDSLGRQTSDTTTLDPWMASVTLASQYDLNGNRTQLAATVGTTADFVNQYTYDNMNELIGLKQSEVTGGDSVAFKQVGLTYNDAGELANVNRFNHAVTSPTSAAGALATSAYAYDKDGRLTGLVNTPSTGSAITQGWSYDALNQVTSYSNSVDSGSTAYGYDSDSQLTSSTQGTASTYGYDANGNRTAGNGLTSTPGPGNRLVSDGTFTYTYDAEGNLIQRVNPTTNDQLNLTYDHRNRLIAVEESSGDTDHPLLDILYDYDVFNRLVSRSETDYTYADGGEGNSQVTSSTLSIEKRVYDGDHVVLDFLSTSSIPSYGLEHRYLYGSAIDQVFAQENANGDVLWMLTDNLGTVRDLANNSGQVVEHFTYDAFGQVTSGDTSLTRYLYTGRDFDATTGLQYNRARWYDPEMGRFLSEDPTGFADGPNPFAYVHNAPTNYTDPSGLSWASWLYGDDGGEANGGNDAGPGNDGGPGDGGTAENPTQPTETYDPPGLVNPLEPFGPSNPISTLPSGPYPVGDPTLALPPGSPALPGVPPTTNNPPASTNPPGLVNPSDPFGPSSPSTPGPVGDPTLVSTPVTWPGNVPGLTSTGNYPMGPITAPSLFPSNPVTILAPNPDWSIGLPPVGAVTNFGSGPEKWNGANWVPSTNPFDVIKAANGLWPPGSRPVFRAPVAPIFLPVPTSVGS